MTAQQIARIKEVLVLPSICCHVAHLSEILVAKVKNGEAWALKQEKNPIDPAHIEPRTTKWPLMLIIMLLQNSSSSLFAVPKGVVCKMK